MIVLYINKLFRIFTFYLFLLGIGLLLYFVDTIGTCLVL
jgi:hypothetical protein